MSNEPNLLTPIVDATFDVVSLLCKTIFNAMGKSLILTYDVFECFI